MKLSTRHWRYFLDPLRYREEFETHGALYGTRRYPYGRGCGQLAGEPHERLHRQLLTVDYIVFSYETPIAWHDEYGWTVNLTKYSQTTSRHQHAIHTALSVLFPAPDSLTIVGETR